MKIPLSWIREFVSIPKSIGIDQITAAFVRIGFEVEGVFNPAESISGPLQVGTVKSIEELAGHKKPIRYVGLDLNEKNIRYVICGATNFKVGDQVVVALPGSVLPGGFAISARETYGKLSDGMICSSRELGLSDEHSGIIVLEKTFKNGSDALVAIGANDSIFDISINPDRGYAMSVRGLSRELAMALNVPFKDYDFKKLNRTLTQKAKPKSGKKVQVEIADKTGADHIFVRTLVNYDVNRKSPSWMTSRLNQCGVRSISLAVDVTNYVMLELGQPLHAFDASKIKGKLIVQRAGKYGEIRTLDGQKRKLSPADLLIADQNGPLALAGIMGGLESEIVGTTKEIALEATHFNSQVIAQNSRRHMLTSEASRRFERGVDPQLAELASARAAQLLIDLGGATYVGATSKGVIPKISAISVVPKEISQLIGASYSVAEISRALLAIGCKISKARNIWRITPPSWRRDLENIADLSEEVARFYGYDRIPSVLPHPQTGDRSGLTYLQRRRRDISLSLAQRGFTEVQNYPFTNEKELKVFGFTGDRAKAFRIANPISDEYPLLRTHLSPGLLATAKRNLDRGAKSVALFESGLIFRDIKPLKESISPATIKRPTDKEISAIYENVPFQSLHIGAVAVGEIEESGWWGKGRITSWQDAVEITDALLGEIVEDFTIKNTELAPWHPGRCAEFIVDNKAVAHAGEIHPRVLESLGLPERTIFFAIVLDALPKREQVRAKPVSTMPAAIQDISLFVPKHVPATEVSKALVSGAGPLLESIALFDRFENDSDEISLAFTLTFRAPDRTLTSEEVSVLREKAGQSAVSKIGARIRG
jgi:phenylalanyl-tRNA synthetase beta chain